jgi:stage II sporulation protein AA (anti-sigma F factor antagonist)
VITLLKQRLTEIELDGYILKVKIHGDIDHHTVKGVREQIDSAILSHRPRFVILNLSCVEFMDSSGLGLILGRYNCAQNIGAKLILYKPTRRINKILAMAGIERIIEIKGDDDNEMF